MSPEKKGRRLRPKRSPLTKISPEDKKKHGKELVFDTKSWIKKVQHVKMRDYEFDAEIMEINSDVDSDEQECNLKELEVILFILIESFSVP